MSEPNYTISPDGTAITCHICGMTSHHPQDVAARYCGNCHLFHEANRPQQYLAAIRANAEVATTNATLQSQLSHAEGKAAILQSQLGGWEAACAAQVTAARAYLTAMRNNGHNAYQVAARSQLEEAIDSNAGEILLARLRPADELADAVEQEHEMRRAAKSDPDRGIDLAAASYRLGAALASYRKAQKGR